MLLRGFLRNTSFRVLTCNHHHYTYLPSSLLPNWQNTAYKILYSVRMKYTQHNGIKGIRSRKNQFKDDPIKNDEENMEDHLDGNILEDREYNVIANNAMHIPTDNQLENRVVVIQPYIKWGPNKSDTNPDLKLQEAEALIRSIPNWKVELSIKVPLETLAKKTIFGSGKIEELKKSLNKLRSKGHANCIFISKGTLSFIQKRTLENEFGLPILDRYSIVIQILRLHATSAEAKIQVAMAEIPYIWGQMTEPYKLGTTKQGFFLSDAQKDIIKSREQKLKTELENIRNHRKLLRNKRKLKNYPIVAVVGYTNAGKTSLIKALSDEQSMKPSNKLFATLDVTAHAGMLPCNLEVIYMDTVGFMSDLPTGLIECFVATLEDAIMADVIIHVQDISQENFLQQKEHVLTSLKSLSSSLTIEPKNSQFQLPPIINVGNKSDLMTNEILDKNAQMFNDLQLLSSKTLQGINNLLKEIEEKILQETGRKKLTIRVKSGGLEMAWLYKNAAVTDVKADAKDYESTLMDVIITDSILAQFKHYFCK